MLAKKIIKKWKEQGLPVWEIDVGSVGIEGFKEDLEIEDSEKEILEIEKDPKKLKEFWESLSKRKYYKKEDLENFNEQEEKDKKRFGLK